MSKRKNWLWAYQMSWQFLKQPMAFWRWKYHDKSEKGKNSNTFHKIFNFNSIYHALYIEKAIYIVNLNVSQLLSSHGTGEECVQSILYGKT
jgi:hypothetical protein